MHAKLHVHKKVIVGANLHRLTYNVLIDPPPCGFLKNVSSIERVEPWFFVTFNIILKHIFPENFIEFPQVAQKI